VTPHEFQLPAPEVIRIDPVHPAAHDVDRIVKILRAGGVVAYPTDTLYGLAVDPRSDAAVERLYEVKGRDERSAITLIAADVTQAGEVCRLEATHLKLARTFWPGPLTLVGDARAALPGRLLAGGRTVAVRVPAHPAARAIARALGFCITATSANRAGEAPAGSATEVAATVADRIDAIVDAGPAPGGAPSTIVALREGAPVLVRAGAIAWDRVLESLQ
jgi:L-threonylcarbamoyladenylate synthase